MMMLDYLVPAIIRAILAKRFLLFLCRWRSLKKTFEPGKVISIVKPCRYLFAASRVNNKLVLQVK